MPEPHAAENLPEKPAVVADPDVDASDEHPLDDFAAAQLAERAMIRTIGCLLTNVASMDEHRHACVEAAINEMLEKACERASRIFESDLYGDY